MMDAVAVALEAIDAANADDPTDHDGEPLARAQGRLADHWARRLDPDASDALRLAARAHHLRRWVVPRSSYPEGRNGYLRWRRDQKARHAIELTEILDAAGVADTTVERAAAIVQKKGLGCDPEVQVFQDAVSLTFVQTQLAATAARLDADHMVEVIAKTLVKMSAQGRAAAAGIPIDAAGAALVGRAVEHFAAG